MINHTRQAPFVVLQLFGQARTRRLAAAGRAVILLGAALYTEA